MSVSRNAVYNVVGAAFPSLLTLITIPAYLALIGVERFGVLTLCWVILGYAGILDVGLGYSAARKIAASRDDPDDAARTFWTTTWISLLIGLAGGLLMYVGASLYFSTLAEAGSPLASELAAAAPVLGLIVPIAMVAGVLSGALAGRERFLTLNVAGVVLGTLMSALPLGIAYFWSSDLSLLVASLLVARLLPMPFVYRVCRRAVPLGRPLRPDWARVPELVSFGSWTSLFLTANSIIQTLDRLLIGSRIGPAAVPIYAIPYGLVSRIILVPHSLSSALFPRFAYVDADEAGRLTSTSIQSVAVIITPALIGLVGIAEPFFRVWIGEQLAVQALPVAYVLAGGFWIYCIGHMAATMVQSTGRPDRVAKVVLAEVVPYCTALVAGMWAFGVIGAAAAFALRVTVDFLLQVRLAGIPPSVLKILLVPAALVLGTIAAAAWLPGWWRYAALSLLLLSTAAWSILNIPDALRPYLHRLRSVLPARAQAGP